MSASKNSFKERAMRKKEQANSNENTPVTPALNLPPKTKKSDPYRETFITSLKKELESLKGQMENGSAILELPPEEIEIIDHDRESTSLLTSDFEQLKQSIQESGQTVPIIITKGTNKKYRLVAGYRRLNACAQLETKVKAIYISELDQQTFYLKRLSENMIRQDLNVFEKANTVYQIINNEKSFSAKELSKKLGVSKGYISKLISISKIPNQIKKFLTLISRYPSNDGEIKSHIITPSISEVYELSKKITDLQEEQIQDLIEKVVSLNESKSNNSIKSRLKKIHIIIDDITKSKDTPDKSKTNEDSNNEETVFQTRKVKVKRKNNKLVIESLSDDEAEREELLNKIIMAINNS